jgi:hypothetical protein
VFLAQKNVISMVYALQCVVAVVVDNASIRHVQQYQFRHLVVKGAQGAAADLYL